MKEFFDKIKNELTNKTAVSVVDVVLFAFILYALFCFFKKNNASRLIKYVVIFLIISVVLSSELLDFKLLGKVFSLFVVVIFIGIMMLFPQELRRGLWMLSSPKDMQETFNKQYNCTDEELHTAITSIVHAALNMAKKDVGALIVIAPEPVPRHILESGTKLDAILSSQLLEAIFNNKAPLHDGAVFIRGNRILAAGCFLPLTQSLTVDKELGTRHRAAIGVTETNNVLTIIVSEETGVISTAYGGELKRYYDSPLLTDKLEQVYGLKTGTISGVRQKRKYKKKAE